MTDAEHVVLAIPRGEEEELRVVRSMYEGKPYTSLRVWYQPDDSDEWRPTKKGVSVRDRELAQVIDALTKIARKVGTPARVGRPQTPRRQTSLPHTAQGSAEHGTDATDADLDLLERTF